MRLRHFLLATSVLVAVLFIHFHRAAWGAIPVPFSASEITKPGQHNFSLPIDGYNRDFIVYIPSKYDGQHPVPLVFFLHGAGGSALGASRIYGWQEKAEQEGFIVVFGQGLPVQPLETAGFLRNPNIWRDHRSSIGKAAAANVDDVHYFKVIMDQITGALSIDPDRIYITGFSNGAGMTFTLGASFADRIAAIAPFSSENPQTAIVPSRPISMLYMTGTEDPLNPVAGGLTKMPWGNSAVRPSVQQSLDQWVKWDGCSTPGIKKTLPDGVTQVTYNPGPGKAVIVAYYIDGMGHHWSGSRELLPQAIVGPIRNPVQATDIVWDFFVAHPLVH